MYKRQVLPGTVDTPTVIPFPDVMVFVACYNARQQLRISCFGQRRLAAYCDVNVEHRLSKATGIMYLLGLNGIPSLSTNAQL